MYVRHVYSLDLHKFNMSNQKFGKPPLNSIIHMIM